MEGGHRTGGARSGSVNWLDACGVLDQYERWPPNVKRFPHRQNGFTTTRNTISNKSTVGTSFRIR